MSRDIPLVLIDKAVAAACRRIMASWPLDRWVATNPLWRWIDKPLPEVSAHLGSLSGTRLLPSRAWYKSEWNSGRIRAHHLRDASEHRGSSVSLTELLACLESPTVTPARRMTVADVLDESRDLVHEVSWTAFLNNSISQCCASFFDDTQAPLGPCRDGGLFATWHRQALVDKSPRLLMSMTDYPELVARLCPTADVLFETRVSDLGVAEDDLEDYFLALLLRSHGWASLCAYSSWQSQLRGGQETPWLRELLALRVAWEWLLLRHGGQRLKRRWLHAMGNWSSTTGNVARAQALDWIWQTAAEFAVQERLAGPLFLGSASPVPWPTTNDVQVVFCIDPRSEPFRRALESQSSRVQTKGFAGFFGLPLETPTVHADQWLPHAPGVLAPTLRVRDDSSDDDLPSGTTGGALVHDAWAALKTHSPSMFSFVETLGLASGFRLFSELQPCSQSPSPDGVRGQGPGQAFRKPILASKHDGSPLSLGDKVEVAERMLRGMSVEFPMPRLLVLVGHGSASRNNPHASTLQCGACGGHSGDINAKVAAALLNDPDVRRALNQRGLEIPISCHVVAAWHCTSTEEVTVFEEAPLPQSHQEGLDSLKQWLSRAGHTVRTERAKTFGLPEEAPRALRLRLLERSLHWSQVRPEWGLANHAYMVLAPRHRTQHLNLEGRAFLHDYSFGNDSDGAVLKGLFAGPVVVAHWINLQYYASTVDNSRYGSGNKVLHNVVGGHLGVFEGNGGDLRIGLPLQSLHDGTRWVHSPLRLSLFVEAPRHVLESILKELPSLRQLVENDWLHLLQIDSQEEAVYAFRRGRWVPGGGFRLRGSLYESRHSQADFAREDLTARSPLGGDSSVSGAASG